MAVLFWFCSTQRASCHCPIQAGDEAPGDQLVSVSMGRVIQEDNSFFLAVLFLAFLTTFSLTTNTEPEYLSRHSLWVGQPRKWISIPDNGKRYSHRRQRLDRTWCPASLVFTGFRRSNGSLISKGTTLPSLFTLHPPNTATLAYNFYPKDVNNFPLQTGLPRASLCRLFTYK